MMSEASSSAALRCENLCKSYSRWGDRHVLHDLSFEVPRGRLFVVAGPNGAGKTTLLHLILGLLHPLRGRLEVLGSGNIEAVRGRLGYLAEKENYPPGLTGREYLAQMNSLAGVDPAGIAARVEQALERFGLASAADLRLSKYSSGMLKRLGLAAAGAGEPELIVMDEPADNLDPAAQRQLSEWFRQLRDEGRTLLLSTHHLEALRSYGEDLLILCDGGVAYRGTLQDLQGSPSAYRLEFEEAGPRLERLTEQGNLPFRQTENGLLLLSVEPEARRKAIALAVEEGLTLNRCEPVLPDLTGQYERALEKYRRSRQT